MSLTGGKRKVNKSLKAWVTFVKKVQKEEKLSYKDAIHRAKIRKDKGEKWMSGGALSSSSSSSMSSSSSPTMGGATPSTGAMTSTGSMETVPLVDTEDEESELLGVVGQQMATAPYGGKRRRRTMRRSKGRGRGRTARRARGRASRRH